jgi:hypothetical protein
MKRFAFILALALAGVLMTPTPAAAGIGFEVDVLWSPDPDNDTQVFLHATNIAYPAPRERVTAVFNRIPDPYDDYPVVAFIAYNARLDPGTVWAYRARGHSWFDCMIRFGVRPDVLFVQVPHDPGPPYGKAYGYWRKHGNRMSPKYVDDDDVRFWVRTRTVARYTGVTPARAYEMHRQGKGFDKLAGSSFREKNARGASRNHQQTAGFGAPKGKGSDKGNSKGKGSGNGKGNGKGSGKNKGRD